MAIYNLKLGDTLYSLAQDHRISLNQLLEMNPGLDPDNYDIGQTINVPSSQEPNQSAEPYIHPSAYEPAYEPDSTPRSGSGTPWFDIAKREMEWGVREIPGRVHNPRIVEYHKATTLRATTDETPWCSAFANWCMKQAGIKGTRDARAISWLNWGRKLNSPRPGCIVVFDHHVGFYYGEKGNYIQLLGGNQSDQVKISGYKKSSVRAYRWPRGY